MLVSFVAAAGLTEGVEGTASSESEPEYGILSIVSWGTYITYWNYSESSPHFDFVIGAKTELWRQGMWWEKISTGYTDNYGGIIWSVETGRTYKVKVLCDDGHSNKVTHDGWWIPDPLAWESATFTPTGSGHNHFDIAAGTDHVEAWGWYHNVRSAHNWLQSKVGWSCPHVTTYGFADHTDSHGNIMHAHGEYGLKNAAFARHEYAHCVMYHARSGSLPPGHGVQPHYADMNTNPGNAISEGWASFLECAIPNSDTSHLETGVVHVTLGVYVCFADDPFDNDHGDYGDWDGNEVEGAASQIFWDIWDGVNANDKYPAYCSYGDNINQRFDRLWSVILNDDPNSLTEFYTDWCNRFNSGNPDTDLKNVFKNMRILV